MRKLIIITVIVIAVFKFCFIIDEGLEKEVNDLDLYSNVKQNVKKRNEYLTVEKTNQKLLQQKHHSKYESSERIIEPIGD